MREGVKNNTNKNKKGLKVVPQLKNNNAEFW